MVPLRWLKMKMTPQSKEMNQPPRSEKQETLSQNTNAKQIDHWNLIFTQVSKGGGYSKVDISKVNFEGKPLHKPREAHKSTPTHQKSR